MADVTYTIAETDLASRHAGARFRALIEARARAGDRIAIDVTSVLSLSESYADELFGVLVARYGLDWFVEHIAVRGANPVVFHSIADAIRYRLQANRPGEPDIALLAARDALDKRRRSVAVSGRR